jgi:hypothetical protein
VATTTRADICLPQGQKTKFESCVPGADPSRLNTLDVLVFGLVTVTIFETVLDGSNLRIVPHRRCSWRVGVARSEACNVAPGIEPTVPMAFADALSIALLQIGRY